MDKYFVKIEEIIAKKVPPDWEFVCERNKLKSRWWYPLRIQESNASKVFFAFGFDGNNFISPYYGIVRRFIKDGAEINLDNCTKNDNFMSLIRSVSEFPYTPKNVNWLGWEYLYKGDVFDYILEKGGVDEAAKKTANKLLDAFHAYKEIIMACNKILDDQQVI